MSTPIVSVAQYREISRKPRKYKNSALWVGNEHFPSQKEARRYKDLLLMQKAGAITGLVIHPRFPLNVSGEHIGDYIADFQYFERGARVVEDVKSPPTRTALYRWKIKHLKAQYGIEVRET